jgi:uncharacterized protein (TIGR02246 family)
VAVRSKSKVFIRVISAQSRPHNAPDLDEGDKPTLQIRVAMTGKGSTMAELQEKVSDAFEALDKAWNAGDADGIAAVFAPDCVLVSPYGAVARGRDEVRELFRIGFSAALKGSSRHTVINSVRPVANSTAAFLGSGCPGLLPIWRCRMDR